MKIPEWPVEKIRLLTPEEIKRLKDNAIKFGRSDIADNCDLVISESPVKTNSRSPRRTKKESSNKSFANEISESMGQYAKVLAQEFDLSEKTARSLSIDTKRYQYHSLTDKKGKAKTGGPEKSGEYEFDRYLSFRLGNDVVAISVFLEKDKPIENTRYQIQGPTDLIINGISFEDSGRRGVYAPSASIETIAFKDYDNLDAALHAYRELLEMFLKSNKNN